MTDDERLAKQADNYPCPVCAKPIYTYPPYARATFKGCCSQACARTLVMIRAMTAVSMQLTELIVATAVEQNYSSSSITFEENVEGILNFDSPNIE